MLIYVCAGLRNCVDLCVCRFEKVLIYVYAGLICVTHKCEQV